ncbi:MAG: hypothetical protein R6U63_01140 [Longimicrobiales bacterium]
MASRYFVIVAAVLVMGACDRLPVSARYSVDERVEIGATSTRAHPLWPRYHRALQLWVLGGKKMAASLGVRDRDAGRINLFKIDSSRYVARADEIDFMVNVDSMTIMELPDAEEVSAKEFLGAFDWDDSREWRFITAEQREARPLSGEGDG